MGRKTKLIEARNNVYAERNEKLVPKDEPDTQGDPQCVVHDPAEYEADSLFLIQKAMLDYVDDAALPLCEYLSVQELAKFIGRC